MAGSAEDHIATLQRYIDAYGDDIATVQTALKSAPDAAQRVLVGALNYGLDMLDIFPDHYRGLGVADDAVVLRLAARQALSAGATDDGLKRLAADAKDVDAIFAELSGPLDKLVAVLADRAVRGRTAQQILGSKDVRVMFEADVTRQVQATRIGPIDTSIGGAAGALKELRKMAQHALKKAGLV